MTNDKNLLSIIFVLGSGTENMDNVNKSKNKAKITAILLSLATVLIVAGISTSLATLSQSASAQSAKPDLVVSSTGGAPNAPAVVSGDNIYIAWWTNNTENGNEEIMFRASTDGGATFSNKTNLSNTTDADSWRVEIAGEGDTVVVSWWETNQTSDVPVARVSTDAGETFGPLIMLGMNGTLGSGEAEEIAGAEEEEGGEGGATTGLEELLPNEEVVPTEEET